jgi:hypothetical protein
LITSTRKRDRHHVGDREGGSGLISTSLGLVFFLITMMVVTQVSAHLLGQSSLRADLDHAARIAASASVQRQGTGALERSIEAQLALLRARRRDQGLELRWRIDGTRRLVLEASTDTPARAVNGAARLLGLQRLHATVSIRLEELRT